MYYKILKLNELKFIYLILHVTSNYIIKMSFKYNIVKQLRHEIKIYRITVILKTVSEFKSLNRT